MINKAKRTEKYLKEKSDKAHTKKIDRNRRNRIRRLHGAEVTRNFLLSKAYPIHQFSLDDVPTKQPEEDPKETKEPSNEDSPPNSVCKAENEFSAKNSEDGQPKVLITTNNGIKPRFKKISHALIRELLSVFPNSVFYDRKDKMSVRQVVEAATKKRFTAVLIVHQDTKLINSLVHINLPSGPTAFYKLSGVRLGADLENRGHPLVENPEVVLNNFNSSFGLRVGRMLSSLFPQAPNFNARQVVTFHNQRDFVFFTWHRYIFGGSREKPQVSLQELGPRMTLKLRYLQKGCYDRLDGDFEWKFEKKYGKRRNYFL